MKRKFNIFLALGILITPLMLIIEPIVTNLPNSLVTGGEIVSCVLIIIGLIKQKIG